LRIITFFYDLLNPSIFIAIFMCQSLMFLLSFYHSNFITFSLNLIWCRFAHETSKKLQWKDLLLILILRCLSNQKIFPNLQPKIISFLSCFYNYFEVFCDISMKCTPLLSYFCFVNKRWNHSKTLKIKTILLSASSPLIKMIASILGVPLTCYIVILTNLLVKR
jgi:hypothetical protein